MKCRKRITCSYSANFMSKGLSRKTRFFFSWLFFHFFCFISMLMSFILFPTRESTVPHGTHTHICPQTYDYTIVHESVKNMQKDDHEIWNLAYLDIWIIAKRPPVREYKFWKPLFGIPHASVILPLGLSRKVWVIHKDKKISCCKSVCGSKK